MTSEKRDFVEEMVARGCKLLRLEKHTKIFQQLAKFVIVGVLCTIINWTVYFVAVQFANIDPLIASAIAFAVATIFNYWTSITWVFDTTSNKTRRRLFVEFMVFNGFSFLMFDEGMLWLLIYPLGWNYMIAKVITTACAMVFNFVTRKMFLEDHSATKSRVKRG